MVGDIHVWFHQRSKRERRKLERIQWTPDVLEALGLKEARSALIAQVMRDRTMHLSVWESSSLIEQSMMKGHYAPWIAETWARRVIEFLDLQIKDDSNADRV